MTIAGQNNSASGAEEGLPIDPSGALEKDCTRHAAGVTL
jgi:hypothetical protein